MRCVDSPHHDWEKFESGAILFFSRVGIVANPVGTSCGFRWDVYATKWVFHLFTDPGEGARRFEVSS